MISSAARAPRIACLRGHKSSLNSSCASCLSLGQVIDGSAGWGRISAQDNSQVPCALPQVPVGAEPCEEVLASPVPPGHEQPVTILVMGDGDGADSDESRAPSLRLCFLLLQHLFHSASLSGCWIGLIAQDVGFSISAKSRTSEVFMCPLSQKGCWSQ